MNDEVSWFTGSWTRPEKSHRQRSPRAHRDMEGSVGMLSPKALGESLGEALGDGVRVVTLINRSGLVIGCAGDAASAPAISAIVSSVWQQHDKCESHGALSCLLLECELGRVAVKGVGPFILAVCSDTTVPAGLLKAKVVALTDHLLPSLERVAA